jgi:hypothetical protein
MIAVGDEYDVNRTQKERKSRGGQANLLQAFSNLIRRIRPAKVQHKQKCDQQLSIDMPDPRPDAKYR